MKSILVFVLLLIVSRVHGFLELIDNPTTFKEDQRIDIFVNKLTSTHTQIPYGYYTLPFCRPEDGIKIAPHHADTLGMHIRGDLIQTSPFQLIGGRSITCKTVCNKMYTKKQINEFEKKIRNQYRVHWIVDELDVTEAQNIQEMTRQTGFPLGFVSSDKSVYLYNHFDIQVHYYPDPSEPKSFQIVLVEVIPASISYPDGFIDDNCEEAGQGRTLTLKKLENDDKMSVTWTYGFRWVESKIPGSERLQRLMRDTSPEIHWFSIVNSLVIVLFLSGMVGMIFVNTIFSDIKKYNEDLEDEIETTGWKLVAYDVYRTPRFPMLLSTLTGAGIQILGMTMVTLFFAVLGLLSPASRGSLTTAVVVVFVLMGMFAGYFSTRIYIRMNEEAHKAKWKKNALLTATLFPAVVFSLVLFLNMFLVAKGSSAAYPFSTLFTLFALWFGVSLPLVWFGSYYAMKQPVPKFPCKTNTMERHIPGTVWYMHPVASVLMGGVLPFGSVFIELYFIMTALWGQQFYYMFPFLFAVLVILVLTCIEISIIMCYFQLCAENHKWWWLSFLTAGCSGLYVFLYSLFYLTELEINSGVPTLLYLGYSLIISLGFFALTGAVGFFSSFTFVTKIYGQIKID